MTALPWQFWQGIDMAHRIRWVALGVYVLVLIVLMWPAFCVAHGLFAWDRMNEHVLNEPSVVESPPTSRFVIHAMLLPFSSTSAGDITYQDIYNGTGAIFKRPFPAPSYFLDQHRPPSLLPFLVFGIVPLCFALMPISRMTLIQRFQHAARIGAYSVIFVLPVIVWTLLRTAGMYFQDLPGALFLVKHYWTLCHLVIPGIMLIWWGFAASRYLRTSNPWPSTLVIFGAVMILGMIVAALLESIV